MSRPPGTGRALVPLLALSLTLLNGFRPVAVDDPAYLRQAAWWAAHPWQPLGGEALLYQAVVPAAQVAAPPVAIAWLALGTWITHGSQWALKLWLLPFAWLLAWALHRLLRRAAPSTSGAWLVALVLAPAVLPSFGFMLEVPMLALAAAALAAFAEADVRPWRSALVAGVLAGLALQTKYSAVPVLVALIAWGAIAGRPRAGLLAVAVALAVFAGIEGALFAGARTSPLVAYLVGRGGRDPGGHAPLLTARRLVLMAGTAAPALIPLGLTALGAPRRLVHVALGAILAGFACLAFAPAALVVVLDRVTGGRIVNFENVAIGWMGPALLLIAAIAAWRTGRGSRAAEPAGLPARVLLAWLGAECLLAPFVSASASVRRVLGALAALGLVLARLANEVLRREPARRVDVTAGAVASVLLGLVFWGADVDSALAERRSLAQALARLGPGRARVEVAVVADHWGAFQQAAVEARLPRLSLGRASLRAGDWLLVPFSIGRRSARLDSGRVELVDSVLLAQRLPLTTRGSFFDGRMAIGRADPAQVGVRLWRVTAHGEVLRPR